MKTSHASSKFPVPSAVAPCFVAIIVLIVGTGLSQTLATESSANDSPANKSSANKSANPKSTPKKLDDSEPWTVDAEQRVAAAEEFQAVDDRATELKAEEMPAYWRVMSWVEQQPLEQLRRQPAVTPIFNQFLQQPESIRGQLVKLDLNVCRVLSYSVPENRLGLTQLYEIWGWTGESKAWLYAVVTPELPKGFPIGGEVSERATCYGYFFKIQGYLEGSAAPRARPLPAPLFLGRLEWNPRHAPQVAGNDSDWIFGISVILGALVVGRIVFLGMQRRRSPRATRFPSEEKLTAEQWLTGMQRPDPAGASAFHNENSESGNSDSERETTR